MKEGIGIELGASGTSSEIGSVIKLQKREDEKEDLLLSTPLSIEINIDNNNLPPDKVIFTSGSGTKKKTIAILDHEGNLRIKGEVIPNFNFDN